MPWAVANNYITTVVLMIILAKMSRLSPVGKQLVAWAGGQFRTGISRAHPAKTPPSTILSLAGGRDLHPKVE